jgi:hypothetical protein
MLDDATAGASAPAPRCTWCSAELPTNHETVCPSCGATLVGDGETQVPGLTAIDAEAILRNARSDKPRQRSRLMSWISGDYENDGGKSAAPGSLAPPPAAVRREILLLELEAQVANAQAEVEAMAADAALEGRTLPEIPGAPAPEAAAGDDATGEALADPIPTDDAAEAVSDTGVADADPDANRPA